MVALKNFLTLCMRGAAILVLVLEGDVNWNYGVPMAIGGLVGGYIGGMVGSIDRYRDWFCRVGLLPLEIIRPGRGAGPE